MAEGSMDGEHLSYTERLSLGDFESGTALVLHLEDEASFFAFVADPANGTALVRPAIPGQRGAGYRDAMSTVGTRSFEEGVVPRTLSREQTEGEGVSWGEIVFGGELVLRNEDDGADTVMFFGKRIEAVSVAEPVDE
jgi:hypothetical protein